MRFGAFDEPTLSSLRQHHEQALKSSGIKRSHELQRFSYGSMVPFGARLPAGGKRGDGYHYYPGMKATSEEEISVVFGHAQVSDTLLPLSLH